MTMRKFCLTLACCAGLAAGPALAADDASALAASSGCNNCHAVDAKKVGPSYKDIAAKYKGKADAQKSLVDKLSSAKGHPAVKAKGDDLVKLVSWVLAQ